MTTLHPQKPLEEKAKSYGFAARLTDTDTGSHSRQTSASRRRDSTLETYPGRLTDGRRVPGQAKLWRSMRSATSFRHWPAPSSTSTTTLLLVAARHDLSNSTETKHVCMTDSTARPTLLWLGNRNASRAEGSTEQWRLTSEVRCTPTSPPHHGTRNQNGAGSRVPTPVVARDRCLLFHGRNLTATPHCKPF